MNPTVRRMGPVRKAGPGELSHAVRRVPFHASGHRLFYTDRRPLC